MQTPPRAAVVTTYNRLVELTRLLTQLGEQSVALIVVVDNDSEASPLTLELLAPLVPYSEVILLRYARRPPNLYEMWNSGFVAIARCAEQRGWLMWDTGVFNDDATLPPGWFNAVARAMREHSAAAASSDPYGHVKASLLRTEPDGLLATRMCPWAFVTRGELAMRADENFGWWWGDTDLDWRCRQTGGVVIIPGYLTGNTCANSTTTGELAEQAGRDGEYFTKKWGRRPW